MKLGRLRRWQFGFWRYAEPRAILEWQCFYTLRPLLRKLPKGDGHPVLVFPGFASSDRATRPMRGLLNDLGYRAHGWGLGSNLILDEHLELEMVAMVREIAQQAEQKVSLLGWSLGGVYAREIAKSCPQLVRNVITLASPISGAPEHANVHAIFQAINGKASGLEQARRERLSEAPPVPTTSIYSKTDGIVAWEGSVQPAGSQTENIEVPASHLGIGVNPLVMMVLADRLAQPDGSWAPFRFNGVMRRMLFKRPRSESLQLQRASS